MLDLLRKLAFNHRSNNDEWETYCGHHPKCFDVETRRKQRETPTRKGGDTEGHTGRETKRKQRKDKRQTNGKERQTKGKKQETTKN